MTDRGAALWAQTPCGDRGAHLHNDCVALLSHATLAGLTGHLRLEAQLGGVEAAADMLNEVGVTYEAIAELVNGRRSEITLSADATHAWNTVLDSIPLRPGDRILTGRTAHGSTGPACLRAAQRTGAEMVVVPHDESGQLDVEALAALADGPTRVIAISHVHADGGLIAPATRIGRIGRAARAAGALFLLDVTRSVGQFPVNVQELGCDLLVGIGHTFLRGPRSTAFLWVRDGARHRLDPHHYTMEAELDRATQVIAGSVPGRRQPTHRPPIQR